jgi:ATP-dependent HslUV protease subunit HslV
VVKARKRVAVEKHETQNNNNINNTFVTSKKTLIMLNNSLLRSAKISSVALRAVQRSFHNSAPVSMAPIPDYHGTTILCVRKNGQVCMMGDGMVSMGSMIVKPNAVKIRRILPKGSVDNQKGTLVGFAGTTADAFTLLERLEGKLDEYPGQLSRSCVELAKGWRTDKYLRRLEAALIVADERISLEITGNGDVLEMHDGVVSVGSGSPYALGKIISFLR